jgi:hypothetical protein
VEQQKQADFDAIAVETMQDVASCVMMTQHKWGAKVTDHAATRELKDAKHATGDAGEFKKNLLNGSKAGKSKVTTAMSKAYRAHVSMTLPWSSGLRIIANSMLLEYMKEMNAQQVALAAAKEEWLVTLPREIETAIQRNGDMGNRSDYPSPQEIVAAFSFEFDFSPIPDARGFSGLPDGFRERFADIYERKASACANAAQQDGVERLVAAVSSFADVLRSDKPRIFESSLDQLKLLHSVAHSFNITGDVRVQEALDKMQSDFLCYDKAQLTGNTDNMRKAAEAADSVLKSLGMTTLVSSAVPAHSGTDGAPSEAGGDSQQGTSEQDGLEPAAPRSQSSEASAEDDNPLGDDPELATALLGD